jgi:hypothetical protein
MRAGRGRVSVNVEGVGEEGAGGILWVGWGLERGIVGGGESAARRRRRTVRRAVVMMAEGEVEDGEGGRLGMEYSWMRN